MRAITIILALVYFGIPTGTVGVSSGSHRWPTADEPYRLFEIYKESDSRPVAKEKLDALAAQIRADYLSEVWLLSYGGKRSCPEEGQKRGEAVRKYLLHKGVPTFQIRVVDGGFREEWSVELWQVVKGQHGPKPEPTLKIEEIAITNNNPPKCPKTYTIP
jgi:hypothetical protein